MLPLLLLACAPQAPDARYALVLAGETVGVEEVFARGEVVERRRRWSVRLGDAPLAFEVVERIAVDDQGAVRRVEVERAGGVDRAVLTGQELVVTRAGGASTRLPPAVLPVEAPGLLGRVAAGETLTVDALDTGAWEIVPTTLSPGDGWIHWASPRGAGRLLLDGGRVVRSEQGPFARVLIDELPEGPPPDLLALLGEPAPALPDARRSHLGRFRVAGAAVPERPRQRVLGDVVEVRAPLLEEIPRAPLPVAGAEDWLGSEPGIEVGDPAVRAEAARALAGVGDVRQAIVALTGHVSGRLQAEPRPGPPSALAALASGRGDCNEHAILWVALARASGLPARVVNGLVWVEAGAAGALVPHAWVEVWTGEPAGWIAVDPALDQPIADATHLGLAVGPSADLSLLVDLRVLGVEVR